MKQTRFKVFLDPNQVLNSEILGKEKNWIVHERNKNKTADVLVSYLLNVFNYVSVEWLIDYLQAMWMSALQIDVAQENISFLTLEKKKKLAQIFCSTFGKKTPCR